MKRSGFLITLTILSMANLLVHGQQIPLDPEVRTGKLSNGLTYYIRHNEMPKGRADFYLAQKVGSVLEEENQRGLAHFLEHMAFNGSKHFPGNSMITELEKKGIKFGSNLNASTSYDETIYKLMNIPVNRSGIVDTALLVLHDWSGFLTLNDKDIDQERGVVREEWRLSAGGGLRVLQNDIFPVIYAGTPYANRLPIGLMDVVNNFKYKELRDYYKKWYRPDLQGIIIVGDVDVNAVEAKIKRLFADIPAPVNPAPRLYARIPENKDPIIAYGTDKELTGTQYAGYWKLKAVSPAEKSSLNWYKSELVNQAIASLLNVRLDEISKKPDAPFLGANIYPVNFFVASLQPAFNLMLSPVGKNAALKAFKGVFAEIERMHRYGFTAGELNDFKRTMLTQIEKTYKDRANTDNRELVAGYIKHFLNNEPATGEDWEYANSKKIITALALDSINYYAKTAMGDENMVIYGTGAVSDNGFPEKKDLVQAWEAAKKTPLEPYVYRSVSTQLMDRKPVGSKIITTENKPFGFIQWTLSNGMKVWFKQTDYKEDNLSLMGYSPGGYSQESDQELLSAQNVNLVNKGGFGNFSSTDLEKALAGKDARLNTFLTEFSEKIDGASAVKDREIMFQLAYLKMTQPVNDAVYFYAQNKVNKEALKDYYADPNSVFRDTVLHIMTNHHSRVIDWAKDPSLMDKADYNTLLRVYKERFGNAGDFTFFIAGNLPADSIKTLVETYLGALPTTGIHEQPKDYGIYPPRGLVKKHFTHAMTTPASSIQVNYTGFSIPYTLENEMLMSFVSRILTINYNKSMREEQGGVYYVNAGGWIEQFPKAHFTFQVSYGTDPDTGKKVKLMRTMYSGIDELMKKGPDLETVNKAKTNLLKQIREWSGKPDANYWNYTASHFFITGINGQNYEKFVSSVTPEMIRDFAKKVFTTDNRIEIEMDPEKKPATTAP